MGYGPAATASGDTREILEARWHAAVTKPKRYREADGGQSTGLDNSDDYYRWQAVAKLATRLSGDGLTEEQLEQVEDIAGDIWEHALKDRLIEWAEERAR